MKFVWIIAIIAAIGGGVYWWQRGLDTPAPARATGAAGAPDAGGGAAAVAVAPAGGVVDAAPIVRAETPTAAAVVEPAAPTPVTPADAVTFEQEPRDTGWAVDQEHELRGRLDEVTADLTRRKAKVAVTAAECRTRSCRIEVGAAGQRELSAFYGALETPEGLLGWADGIVLGDVETDPKTGAMTTKITVVFERDL